MRPEEDIWAEQPTADGPSLDGGADSSNRPWDTDSIHVGSNRASPRLWLLAICAAALLSLADMAIAFASDGGLGLRGPLEALPRRRLLLAQAAAMLLLPLYIVAYRQISRQLADAGAWLRRSFFVLGSLAVLISWARHTAIATSMLNSPPGPGAPPPGRLLALARDACDPLGGWINLPLALASICFVIAVLSGRTGLPRWSACLNPMLVAWLFVAASLLAPTSPAALIVAAASFNLGHLVFFGQAAISSRRAAASTAPPAG